MLELRGLAASPGIAMGPVVLIDDRRIPIPDLADPAGAFAAATREVSSDLARLAEQAESAGREEAAEVLRAQSLMAEDPMLSDAVGEQLGNGVHLEQALTAAVSEISALLAGLDDPYLAARAADVGEVGNRIRNLLAGQDHDPLAALTEPGIVVADTLTAADTAQLDPAMVLAFATATGGPTGHVAVIARSLAIPAVVGVESLVASVTNATTVAVDGGAGTVVVDPDPATRARFDAAAQRHVLSQQAAAAYRGAVVDFDGRPFPVAANVGNADEVKRAVDAAADGIGLYRTEFLFLDRREPPTEEEQYETYAAAAAAFDHPVVVRTFDIGGDKPASYLDTPQEENPFLGERGVRLYARFAQLFEDQISALLRAAALGDVWIMVPMVTTIDDMVATRRVVDDVRARLTAAGVPIGTPRLGAMIEVPSAALIASALARHVDFFSIGTNDLTQYTMAADRTNGRLGRYSDPAHPAVLTLCHQVATAGAGEGVDTSVCGEAAADPALAVLFAAMGMNKLSMSSPAVNLVKSHLADVDPEIARRALHAALQAEDAAAARTAIGAILGTEQ